MRRGGSCLSVEIAVEVKGRGPRTDTLRRAEDALVVLERRRGSRRRGSEGGGIDVELGSGTGCI